MSLTSGVLRLACVCVQFLEIMSDPDPEDDSVFMMDCIIAKYPHPDAANRDVGDDPYFFRLVDTRLKALT